VLDETLRVYDMLKDAKLRSSDFLVMAAYQIATQAKPTSVQGVVNRTRLFYDGMKARRFFTTGQDDYIFAAMLGLSNLDVEVGIERIERLNVRLKGDFSNRSSIQALAQVLVLSGSDETAVCCVLALRDALRAQKIRLDKAYTLPSLGILALLPMDSDTIVKDLEQASETLLAQKGFSRWSVSKQERLLYAATIVAGECAKRIEGGILTATISTSITNIIIAQQAAMMAAIFASTAAAAASSS